MSKKLSLSPIDFHFGVGNIIPSTQEAYKRIGSELVLKTERGQLADFKEAFGKEIDAKLSEKKQFPSPNGFFIFIMQYFTGEEDYRTRDIDNMAKTILDILKGRFYKDDGQVNTLLVGKKVDLKRIPHNFAYVAVREIKSNDDVMALKIAGLERCVTLYQELRSQKLV